MLRQDDDHHQFIAKSEEMGKLFHLELNDELSASERQTLNEWLYQQYPADRQFFQDAVSLCQLDTGLQDYSSIKITSTQPDQEASSVPSCQLAYNTSSSREQAPNQIDYNIISTPRGGQYQVLLPDGNKVWLNTASSLRFPTVFSGKERRVKLSGEPYFEISQHASLPFKSFIAPPLHSDNSERAETYVPVKTEVLSTGFDIMAYVDEREINIDEVTTWKDRSFLFQGATIEAITSCAN
jgi:FecR protein